MQVKHTFGIIGGDLRTVQLAKKLNEAGHKVLFYGIAVPTISRSPDHPTLEDVINQSDILILPLPMLNKNGEVFAPFHKTPIQLSTIIDNIHEGQYLFGGKITPNTEALLKQANVRYTDYFISEALTVENALITAEGCMQTLLNMYEKTICNSNILILGFGRIGKLCAKLLNGFGAKITVAGRRAETRSWVESLGFTYTDIENDESYSSAYEIIINTVPQSILTYDRLNQLNPECIILDLASAPGGTDFAHAKQIGLRTVHALSLPGKTAPIAAGNAIFSAIKEIYEGLEV